MNGGAAGGGACRPPMFSCRDGSCVPPTSLCDDIVDCRDGSDEAPSAGCPWVGTVVPSSEGGGEMPAGILAGMVVCGVLAVVAAVIGVLLLVRYMRRRKQRRAAPPPPEDAPDSGPAADRSTPTHPPPSVLHSATPQPLVDRPPHNQSYAEFHRDEIELAYITERIIKNPPEHALYLDGNSNLGFVPRPISVTFGKTPEDGDTAESRMSASPAAGPEPPILPSWQHVLSRSYPTHTGLARPSPSAPSLNALDRVPEAPSIGHLHHYPASHGSTDVYAHTHSLPDVSYLSAFQKVSTGDIARAIHQRPRSAGNFTRSMTNLTITSTGSNRTVSHRPPPDEYPDDPAATRRADHDVSRSAADLRHTSHSGGDVNYSRSASVPLSYASDEMREYAVPLSVYKTPPTPRAVLSARHHDVRESYY